MKLHTLEDWHPQHQHAGRKCCITQSMQLHLTDAIHNADTEHYRSTPIHHNPTLWICCQHNMCVVPVQPNQQRSSGDKVCNLQQQRERERNEGVYMNLRLCHVCCLGTYWSNWWLVTLAKLWLQMNKEPDRVSSGKGMGHARGRRLRGANQNTDRQAVMISPRVSLKKMPLSHNKPVNFHLIVWILYFSHNMTTLSGIINLNIVTWAVLLVPTERHCVGWKKMFCVVWTLPFIATFF